MLKKDEKNMSGKVARTKPGLVLEAMGKNRRGNARVNVPREYARAEWSVKNPPSLVGLKLLTLMISACGNSLDGFKEFPLSLLREVPGLANVSRLEFKSELEKLMTAQVSAPDQVVNGQLFERFGAVVHDARLVSEGRNVVGFGFYFGETFKGMVAAGEFYTVLDSSIVLALRSRHAVLLYQFLASVAGQLQNSFLLPLDEVRRIFALPDDKFSEFKRFKREVLVPACEQVSELSNWIVKPIPVYSVDNGRIVDRIEFQIDTKTLPIAGADNSAASSSSNGKQKRGRGRPSNSLAAPPPVSASELQIQEFWAASVKDGGKRSLARDISKERALRMLKAGLVTEEDLRARSVAF